MFDSTKNTARLTDAVDLLIDFATLGEYGLEPVGRTARACEADRRPPTLRQSRDASCEATTFASVSSSSPYYDILRGGRSRRAAPVAQ